MTVIRIVLSSHGTDKPTTEAGSGHAGFTAEPISLVSFAFADTLHMGFMHAVNFVW
jgi:hypothetical protein